MIFVTGDIHGNFWEFSNWIKHLKITKNDIIICCGDFGYWPTSTSIYSNIHYLSDLGIKIYWCDGNHEDHNALEVLKVDHRGNNIIQIVNNIFYVPRGNVVEIEDKNFLFMGGADSIDKKWRTPGYDWFAAEDISVKDMNNLPATNTKIDIVISHTCPLEVNPHPVHGKMNPNDSNRKNLSYIQKTYKPKLWYYGHWHSEHEEVINDTQFYGLNMIDSPGWIKKVKD